MNIAKLSELDQPTIANDVQDKAILGGWASAVVPAGGKHCVER